MTFNTVDAYQLVAVDSYGASLIRVDVGADWSDGSNRPEAAGQLNSVLCAYFRKLDCSHNPTAFVFDQGILETQRPITAVHVHRRPWRAPRASARCAARLSHMALRPCWPQGHVT
jgi:hypothetical protein